MLLLIDNYDSFTYNLVQYFGQLGADILVRRNDKISLAEIEELKPERIIGQVFGGEVVRAPVALHGKTSEIAHDDSGVFRGLAQPFPATRYHSLVVRPESVPDSLAVTAHSEDGQIMGLRHREFPIHGVQFHPESILTSEGAKLLGNFLEL